MKSLAIKAALLVYLLTSTSMVLASDNFEAAIKKHITDYEFALNNADADRVAELFDTQSELIAQGSEPVKGKDGIRNAYIATFHAVHLDIKFEFKEISRLSKNWALARTESKGKIKLSDEKGTLVPEHNNELFILHRNAQGEWLFSKYMYNTVTN